MTIFMYPSVRCRRIGTKYKVMLEAFGLFSWTL